MGLDGQASAEVRGNYSNLAQCMAGVVRDGGIPKLYTGLLASVAVSAPSSAVFVACYECSKNAIEVATSGLPPPFHTFHDFVPLLAAAIGNVAASIVRVPPEVIKQRVQAGIDPPTIKVRSENHKSSVAMTLRNYQNKLGMTSTARKFNQKHAFQRYI